MTHIFISYSRKDLELVERLRNDLRDAGIDIWIDKIGLTPGTLSWEQGLRDAIAASDAILLCASTDSRESAFVRDEVALAKQAGKSIYPAWVAGENWLDCVPLGLGGTQYADLRGDHYTAGLMQLIAAIRGEATVVEPLQPDEPIVVEEPAADFEPRNPYKGLRAFREDDQGDFFGRDSLIAELLAKVDDASRPARMLPVLGASGSGKSSVMMAGLLPKLRENHPDWTYLDPMVPGNHPLEKLTITLARQFENKSQRAIREDLTDTSTRGLHRLACEISDKPVVLYIDQFEEIFTLVNDEAERRHFIDSLATAVTEPDGVLYLLLSMRADFYDRPLQFTPFGKLLETHHVAITPMTLADLYDVVQKPAALPDVRLSFDDGLVTEMVFAVREESAALPLLQFTLDQLFEQREGNRLTMSAYREIGGIQGALAQHADATFEELPSDQHRKMARALFLRLIEPGQTEQDTTRRRASYSELTLPDAEQTRILQETADAFVNARLLVSDVGFPLAQRGDGRGETTLEVSHEALIREWKRLRDWLHDAREDLRLQKSLAADVAEWQRRGKPADRLYRGTVLVDAQAWAGRNTASRDETHFLNESRRAEEERQRREARQRRTLRYALGGLVAVILVSAVGLAAIFAQNNAELQSEATAISGTSDYALAQAATQQEQAAIAQENASTAEGVAEEAQEQAAQAATEASIAESNAATAQSASDFTNLEIARFSTLQAGDVLVPLGTQTPGIFEPTLTAIAVLNEHDPTLPENRMTDEFGVEMVRVPAGCFFMGRDRGDSDEQPAHQICFDEPFWIDKYEVTNEQYGSVPESDFCRERSSEPDQPRNCVTWFEAQAHCEARGARLPTEAEWEYAARGPDSWVYPWGNEWDEERAVFGSNSEGVTAPVGSRPSGASWVGALDMSGNVWEWTSTIYDQVNFPYPYDATDGREDADPDARRVVRGGSFFNTSNFVRAAYRRWYDVGFDDLNVGFRCALWRPPSP